MLSFLVRLPVLRVVPSLAVALFAAPLLAAEGSSPPVPRQAFARADSAAEVARTARALRVGDRLHLEGVALGGERVGLDLERFRVFAEDGELVIHGAAGDETLAFRDHAYFRGPVIGEPGSLATLTVTEDGTVRGLIRRAGGFWSLAPADDGTGTKSGGLRPLAARRTTAAADGTGSDAPAFTCGVDGLVASGGVADLQREAESLMGSLAGVGAEGPAGDTPESLPAALTTTPYTVRVAIETDYELYQEQGGAQAIEEYVGDLIAFASSIYDDEIDTNLVVSHLSTWSTSSDPWTQSNAGCALYEFGRYWNDNRTTIDRTIAHFVAGKGSLAGVAWVGVLCQGQFTVDLGTSSCAGLSPQVDNYGGAYGYTGGIQGSFDPANAYPVWDIIAVSHEIGHNFDSPHTHCYNGLGGSSDPVDECYNGEEYRGCFGGSPSLPSGASPGQGGGTIMSYCHFQSGGLSNIAFTFGTGHPYGVLPERVPTQMRTHVEIRAGLAPACFTREESNGGGASDPPCPDELFLTHGNVTGTVTESTCGVIWAGESYQVMSGGDLTLEGFRVVLTDGFSVQSGGSLAVVTQ